MIESNNETKFVNLVCSLLFKASGIVHQTSCAYTPWQNGVAERKHQYTLEVTRTLRFYARIPIYLWGYCVLYFVYIINRLPSSVLEYQTPYTRLHGRKSNYNHLSLVGRLCYAKVLHEQDKLQSRAKFTTLLGYSEVKKEYVLFDLINKVVFVSKYISFREEVFPFK